MQLFKNNAVSTLAATLSSSGDYISIASGTGNRFPEIDTDGDYFLLTLLDPSTGNKEIVKCIAHQNADDVMQIERAKEGTTAQDFPIGTIVSMRVTAGLLDKLHPVDFIYDHENDLAKAISTIGDRTTTLLIDREIQVNEDITVPENICLEFTRNGKITVNVDTNTGTPYVLTINGAIKAGLWQIFDGDGVITGSPKIEAVYPEWFGAKGDGVTDDTRAIQKAVQTFKPFYTVYFTKNKYLVTSKIILEKNQTYKGDIDNKSIIYGNFDDYVFYVEELSTNNPVRIVLDGLTICSDYAKALYINAIVSMSNILNCTFYSTFNSPTVLTGRKLVWIKGTINTINNCFFTIPNINNYGNFGLYLEGATYSIVTNNWFNEITGEAIRCKSSLILIEGNRFVDVGGDSYALLFDGTDASNNIISNNLFEFGDNMNYGSLICRNYSNNNYFVNNVLKQNGSATNPIVDSPLDTTLPGLINFNNIVINGTGNWNATAYKGLYIAPTSIENTDGNLRIQTGYLYSTGILLDYDSGNDSGRIKNKYGAYIAHNNSNIIEIGQRLDLAKDSSGAFISQKDTKINFFVGTGSPEGVIAANPGSIYLNTDGGSGATFWVKESGVGTNTGWIAK